MGEGVAMGYYVHVCVDALNWLFIQLTGNLIAVLGPAFALIACTQTFYLFDLHYYLLYYWVNLFIYVLKNGYRSAVCEITNNTNTVLTNAQNWVANFDFPSTLVNVVIFSCCLIL